MRNRISYKEQIDSEVLIKTRFSYFYSSTGFKMQNKYLACMLNNVNQLHNIVESLSGVRNTYLCNLILRKQRVLDYWEYLISTCCTISFNHPQFLYIITNVTVYFFPKQGHLGQGGGVVVWTAVSPSEGCPY